MEPSEAATWENFFYPVKAKYGSLEEVDIRRHAAADRIDLDEADVGELLLRWARRV